MYASRRVLPFMDASLVHSGAASYATPIRVAASLFVAALTAAASQFSVPLLAEVGIGPNWDKAH